jgi:two-component system sensor histidine kinase YesM
VGFSHDDHSKELPQSGKTKLGGVGLKNVHDRIQLYCGKEYGISLDSEINKGTLVTLKLCIKGDTHE